MEISPIEIGFATAVLTFIGALLRELPHLFKKLTDFFKSRRDTPKENNDGKELKNIREAIHSRNLFLMGKKNV